jgi:hypothetical protein
MIFYFTGALLISLILYTLGKYSALLGVIAMTGKITLIISVVLALAHLYRHLIKSKKTIKSLPGPRDT